MSSLLRRLPLSRLLLLCATVVAVAVLCTALASALGGDPKPAPKPLAQAVHDALSAPKPQGFSAHVKLVNHLIEGASLQGQEGNGGSSPLLGDAEGRVWISADGRIRLELQSERGATQILYDGSTLTIYEASSNTLYEYTPPAQKTESGQHAPSGQPPSVAEIQNAITHLMGHVRPQRRAAHRHRRAARLLGADLAAQQWRPDRRRRTGLRRRPRRAAAARDLRQGRHHAGACTHRNRSLLWPGRPLRVLAVAAHGRQEDPDRPAKGLREPSIAARIPI